MINGVFCPFIWTNVEMNNPTWLHFLGCSVYLVQAKHVTTCCLEEPGFQYTLYNVALGNLSQDCFRSNIRLVLLARWSECAGMLGRLWPLDEASSPVTVSKVKMDLFDVGTVYNFFNSLLYSVVGGTMVVEGGLDLDPLVGEQFLWNCSQTLNPADGRMNTTLR